MGCSPKPSIVGTWSANVGGVVESYSFDDHGQFSTTSNWPGEGTASATGSYALADNNLSLTFQAVDTSGLKGKDAAKLRELGRAQIGTIQGGRIAWNGSNQFTFDVATPRQESVMFRRG